jgi:predicted dehydrogenase
MLAGEDLDAVVIATPGHHHREHVRLALAAGLPVLLEKPVALTMADAIAIRDMVERAGLPVAVGYQWRNLDTVDEARQVLGDDPVAMVNGLWYWTTPLVPWIADREQGGGQMVDQVTHLFDLVRYLLGEIRAVYARYTTRARAGQPGFANWDAQAVAFDLDNGAVGAMAATYALFADCPVPTTLDVIQRDRLVRLTPQQLEVHEPGRSRQMRSNGQWGFDLDRGFIEAVATGRREAIRCGVAEAVASLAVSLAANESARTGRPVEVASLLG